MDSVDRDARRHRRDSPEDQRSAFQRDRDRILYSASFRRLGAITQVMAPSERPVLRNRLTHSLEVAQIGRRVAEKLIQDNALDPAQVNLSPDVVEAACLAHDLGHPPFGHVAEDELNQIAQMDHVPEGFNGNAQSFRIVTKLTTRHEAFHGLNLTSATLNAILKYPWLKGAAGEPHFKWGAYFTEQSDFAFARSVAGVGERRRTAEAAIMDWADDVAYAVHDLDDFFRAGVIPLDRLRSELGPDGTPTGAEVERFLQSALQRLQGKTSFSDNDLRQAFLSNLAEYFLLYEPYKGTFRQRALLGSFTAGLIKRSIYAATCTPAGDASVAIHIDPTMEAAIAMLKQLTWEYVIHNPALATQQYGQRKVIRDLYSALVEAAKSPDQWYVFPSGYQERLQSLSREGRESDYHGLLETWDHEFEGHIRLVIDLITSMTEMQTLEMHRKLFGISLGSGLDIAM